MNANEQVEMFADFFASNFASSSDDPTTLLRNFDTDDRITLDPFFIFDQLMRLKSNTNTGPDGIHPLVLKNCASILYQPLTAIFNESLETGSFPDKWKRYSVTPIFKKGARSDIKNYRDIAKLQTIAKFFEHCVNIHLTKLVYSNISPHQHGFMKYRSTTTNLMDFTHYALNGLNSCGQIDVIYTDFSKAFDRVNHKILMHKLSTFEIPSNLLVWIGSYLSNRRQFVKVGSAESRDFIVHSGVPQGSHIGPLLFLMFINDITSVVSDDVFISMFADDVKIAKQINCPLDAQILQSSINKLKDWCNLIELHLNLDKCSVLSLLRTKACIHSSYKFDNHTLASTNNQKDLGVIIDCRLTFRDHVDWIVSKGTSALGFVKRFSSDINQLSTVKAIYSALVQSHLEYCNVVWFCIPSSRSTVIESIQRRFSMFALREYPNLNNNYRIRPYQTRLKSLGLTSLERRRINAALIFLYDVLCNNVHCPYVKNLFHLNENVRNCRNPEIFRIRDSTLSRSSHVPITVICKLVNKAKNLFINSSSRSSFIRMLRAMPDDYFPPLFEHSL